ncbi:ac56-like protein [Alphabaculovirus altersperidaniae]|uniref:Ac56-like protein n=1 Tax=Spodoptera eridania nucleopolyhedrovirus TaxID=2315721 RepID=A0ABX6TVF1_9ABAC|nr:ac56-like protein [Spodoptera eridania nucleopolyhedrovirus]QNV47897.1 ac56-like protein [Spodoptera eridania nucleopolyhedrovirus]
MWWDNATSNRSTTTKSTSFSDDTAHRRIDHYNQVVYCQKCKFIAPMSMSFEKYIELHKRYNEIVTDTCIISFKANSMSASNLIKHHNREDKTL